MAARLRVTQTLTLSKSLIKLAAAASAPSWQFGLSRCTYATECGYSCVPEKTLVGVCSVKLKQKNLSLFI